MADDQSDAYKGPAGKQVAARLEHGTSWADPGSGPGMAPGDVLREVERREGQPLPSDESVRPDRTTDTAKRWPELRSAQQVDAGK